MGSAAFQQNVRLESCEAAGGVEDANHERGILQNQWKRSEAADVDRPAFAEIEPWMTSREYVDRRQRQAPEAAVVRLDRAKRTLCDVYLTAFQHRQQLGTDRVEQLHLNIGIALR